MNGSVQNSEAIAVRRSEIEDSDEEDWSTIVECAVLERSKSDRGTRGDEDRRRRTIIVEKKNGTYGFTLQSYGIHYKREQEIEMVTYVDYIEYDGPAFKAGMREGDVILSINGHEMDRADHKTLVNFIKNCDSRMRMVVSFEDCVRKVDLHMRYIEIQRALQLRLGELERLCERERSILMGRWKTHSLPARKRTPNCGGSDGSSQTSAMSTLNSSMIQCCRPATSTEHLLLYSVYADGRPCLIPRSTACLVAVGPPRSRSDHHHFLNKTSNDSTISSRHSYHQSNGSTLTPSKSKNSSHKSSPSSSQQNCSSIKDSNNIHPTTHKNLCVACISSANRRRDQTESGSLDVYDLASPCCDPNCVPSRKRREKQRRARNEQRQQEQQQQQQQQQQSYHQSQKEHGQHGSHGHSRASGHSLHSIASSEISTAAESAASCSTSLSTDTLYWDPNVQHRPPVCIQYSKPKSWDNLTTKAFGGYGFGYGYLDTASTKTHSAERPGKGLHNRAKTPTSSHRRSAGTSSVYSTSSTSSSRHIQPTKSTENLMAQNSHQTDVDTASLSCECLDGNSRFTGTQDKHKRQDESEYSSGNHQSRHRRSSHGDGTLRSNNNSEVTRL